MASEKSSTTFDSSKPNTSLCNGRQDIRNDGVQAIMSEELRDHLLLVFFPILGGLWSVLGIITNIINIVVFRRMGFHETINLSLFALAVSDFCSLIGLFWVTICFNPIILSSKLPYSPPDIAHLTGGWPHVAFTRVTGWITAFITVERFLCIAKPLTVKRIITVTRVKAILVFVFLATITVTLVPVYLTNLFMWKSVDNNTRTILAMTFTDDQAEIEHKANLFTQLASPGASFGIVVIFALAIMFKLRQHSKWKLSAAASTSSGSKSGGHSQSTKETKAGKMTVSVSTIFVICFTPTIIIIASITQYPEFSINGGYKNIFIVCGAISYMLEGMNSSVNLFVYYRMSSIYKQTFNSLFLGISTNKSRHI